METVNHFHFIDIISYKKTEEIKMEMLLKKVHNKKQSIYLKGACTIISGEFDFHVELLVIFVVVSVKTTSPLFKSVQSVSLC